jgi:hypothetical protein
MSNREGQSILWAGVLMLGVFLLVISLGFFQAGSVLQNATLMVSIIMCLLSTVSMFKRLATSRYR